LLNSPPTGLANDPACHLTAQRLRGEAAILVDLQRKGMQVVIPDAESFRANAKTALGGRFQKEWPVSTWPEVLAQ